MARIYVGDVPCPCCGKTGSDSKRSARDSICFKCMDELIEYKAIQKRTANRKKEYVEFWVKYFDTPYIPEKDDYYNLIASLRNLFSALDSPEMKHDNMKEVTHGNHYNESFAIKRPYKIMWKGYQYTEEGSFIIREDIALALDALVGSIENFVNTVKVESKREGANLLKQLGTQQIRPDEFIERVNRD